MTSFPYRLIDVFTAQPFRGNALAVFRDARGVPEAHMQSIAAELNLSETTFVLPPSAAGCDYRVRIFTPTAELPMAGHPTIGTAWVLDHGDRVVFEEGVGAIAVERTRTAAGAAMWRMQQRLPVWGEPQLEASAVAAALGLEPADLADGLTAEVISCGLPFLVVPLRSLDALGRLHVRVDLWTELSRGLGTDAVYCFTLDTREAGVQTRSRMFAPAYGVGEDAATGSASGPLGCYLVRHGLAPAGPTAHILNVQGVEMGRRSEIHVEIDGSAAAITGVRVGGACVAIGSGRIDLLD